MLFNWSLLFNNRSSITGNPDALNNFFEINLSIAMAEDKTPECVYGILSVSNIP